MKLSMLGIVGVMNTVTVNRGKDGPYVGWKDQMNKYLASLGMYFCELGQNDWGGYRANWAKGGKCVYMIHEKINSNFVVEILILAVFE